MNRFSKKQTGIWSLLRLSLSLCFTCGILFLFFSGLSSVTKATKEEQKRTLEDALHRNVMQCYALEGAYPDSLEYLTTHYALAYDSDCFYVDYRPIGENIFPEITVTVY